MLNVRDDGHHPGLIVRGYGLRKWRGLSPQGRSGGPSQQDLYGSGGTVGRCALRLEGSLGRTAFH